MLSLCVLLSLSLSSKYFQLCSDMRIRVSKFFSSAHLFTVFHIFCISQYKGGRWTKMPKDFQNFEFFQIISCQLNRLFKRVSMSIEGISPMGGPHCQRVWTNLCNNCNTYTRCELYSSLFCTQFLLQELSTIVLLKELSV